MNKVLILGTLTRNSEIKYTQSGTAICNFGIAYNESRKDANGQYKDVPHFFEVTAWGKTAENINRFFHKGSRILIDGSLDFSQWEDGGTKRSKVGIKLREFDFIDRKSDNNNQGDKSAPKEEAAYGSPESYSQHSPQPTSNIPEIDIDDDSIPF